MLQRRLARVEYLLVGRHEGDLGAVVAGGGPGHLPPVRHRLRVVLPLPLELVRALPRHGHRVRPRRGDGAAHPVYVRAAVGAARLHVLHDLPLGAELRAVGRHVVGVHLVARPLAVVLSGLPAGGQRGVVLPDDGLAAAGAGGLQDGALEGVRLQEVCTRGHSEVLCGPRQLGQVQLVAVDDVGGEADDAGAERVLAGGDAEGLGQDAVQCGGGGGEYLPLRGAQQRLRGLDDGVEGGGGDAARDRLPHLIDVARGEGGQLVLGLDVLEGLLHHLAGGHRLGHRHRGVAHTHGLQVQRLGGVEGVGGGGQAGAHNLRGPVPVRDEADGEGVNVCLGDGDHGVRVRHARHARRAQPVLDARGEKRVLDDVGLGAAAHPEPRELRVVEHLVQLLELHRLLALVHQQVLLITKWFLAILTI